MLAGRHAAVPEQQRTSGSLRRLLPAIAGTAVAVVMVGGALAAVRFESGGDHRDSAVTAQDDAASGLDRSGERADRATRSNPGTGAEESGLGPAPSPLASSTSDPSPSPSVSPSTPSSSSSSVKRSTSPTPSGSVASSGTCKASYYDTGTTTASGERFDPDGLTAAHRTLPFNTNVRITNTANGKSVVVRVDDRGPFVSGRCFDLARGAFTQIASIGAGVLTIKYEVLA